MLSNLKSLWRITKSISSELPGVIIPELGSKVTATFPAAHCTALLNIFFGFPNNKKFKTEIQSIMKNKKIDVLESLFLQFIDKKQLTMNF